MMANFSDFLSDYPALLDGLRTADIACGLKTARGHSQWELADNLLVARVYRVYTDMHRDPDQNENIMATRAIEENIRVRAKEFGLTREQGSRRLAAVYDSIHPEQSFERVSSCIAYWSLGLGSATRASSLDTAMRAAAAILILTAGTAGVLAIRRSYRKPERRKA